MDRLPIARMQPLCAYRGRRVNPSDIPSPPPYRAAMARRSEQLVEIGGRRVAVTNLDKVMYPATGTTKGDVIRYYSEIFDVLLPYAEGRPITRKRWVDGVGTAEKPGQVFFQKDLEDSAPEWVPRGVQHHSKEDKAYPVLDAADGRATLVWLAQLAALELHVPQWRFRPDGSPGNPDRMVLDLDPGEGVGLPECVEVAKLCRAVLDDMGLPTVPVTSGSKGIHLYAALDGSHTSDQISALAKELARSLEADHPDLVISTMRKADRRGKVMVDWSQNNAAKTTVAPYSLRGRLRPTVAMPRTWREITSGRLRQIEMHEVLAILRRRGDAAAPLRSPSEPSETKRGSASSDRLSKYRSMRDPAKTPEPVPDRAGAPRDGEPAFVIQRHQARRLHYDFRLERDGVLVSWAVPKGVPKPGERNHLAVHVEDHPLEYASFEGDIPKGEYGAGHVDIWDHGTYETEKWRDDEVIVTLHGSPDGGLGGAPAKVALIRTGMGGDADNWLIHRMELEAPEGPAARGESRTQRPRARPRAAERDRSKPVRTSRRRPAKTEYAPMLAELGSIDRPPRGEELAVEMKWDGWRVLASVSGGTTRLLSRNGKDLTERFPEFADLAGIVRGDAVLDGEVIAVDRRGYPDFGLLQRRMRDAKPAPVRYMLFDILALDGEELISLPYRERRAILEWAVEGDDVVQVPPALDVSIEEGLERARELRLEGIVVKDPEAHYYPGRRSEAWTKLKFHRTQEVVVAGWRPGKGSRSGGIGSLILGVPDEDGLQYVGRVGTGFDDTALAELGRTLARLSRKTPPVHGIPAADARDAHWVRPSLVGEVEYAEVTNDGRLRQPSWRGLRADKSPEEVRWER